MSDGDRRRAGQSVRMPSHQHGGAFVLGEPAAVDQLVLVHLDVVVERLGETAVHQRHRERPWLRVRDTSRGRINSGLFQSFAPHRILERFAGLDEPARHDHRLRRSGRSGRAARGCLHGEHDRDRVGAREMLDLAGRAARFQPASTTSVLTPQLEQKRCRACQCSIALASASGGRCSAVARPWTAIERRSMTNRSSRALRASALAGAMPSRSARRYRAGRGTRSRWRARARAPRPA